MTLCLKNTYIDQTVGSANTSKVATVVVGPKVNTFGCTITCGELIVNDTSINKPRLVSALHIMEVNDGASP